MGRQIGVQLSECLKDSEVEYTKFCWKIFTNLKEMISTWPKPAAWNKFASGKADFHYIWDPKTRHSQILSKKIWLLNGLVFECFMKTRSQIFQSRKLWSGFQMISGDWDKNEKISQKPDCSVWLTIWKLDMKMSGFQFRILKDQLSNPHRKLNLLQCIFTRCKAFFKIHF